MKETEQLEQALNLLRQADKDRGASPFLETRLRAAFREHHGRRHRGWLLRWASAAALMACAAFVVLRLMQPAAVEAPKPVAQTQPATPPPAAVAKSVPAVTPQRGAPVRKRTAPSVQVAKAPRRAPVPEDSGVQEFIALPYAPPLSSLDRGQVMRVRLPRQSLRSLGIPVNEERMFERVPADLLMGEDGLARAIRFVSASEPR
jgi:hypothetical protein